MSQYLWFTVPVFAIGAIAFWWASRRVPPAVRRARWIKFAAYIAIVHGVLLAIVAGSTATTWLMAAIAAAGLVELARVSPRLGVSTAVPAFALYLAIAWRALALTWTAPSRFIAYLYLVVAVFDGFSQASGQIAGRRKLAPAISPGKTMEGFAIGAAITMACALALRGFGPVSLRAAAAVGAVTVVAGLAGDLGASWVKRRAGVKDYGTILPGHGGVLDRFDSLLAVAATVSFVAAALTSGSS